MLSQSTFKRYETKYLLTKEQYNHILDYISDYVIADAYGKSTIANVYFDTPNYLLIRRSLEKPIYKEKLRIRTYGLKDEHKDVFIEIKKKFKSVVYKRRTKINYQNNINLFTANKISSSHITANESSNKQILGEISYFIDFYKDLRPSMYLQYDREAFYAKDDENLRITFDSNILYRNYDFTFTSKSYGKNIISKDNILMEIKSSLAYPLWLVKVLSQEKVNKTSFSKYGIAYQKILQEELNGNI